MYCIQDDPVLGDDDTDNAWMSNFCNFCLEYGSIERLILSLSFDDVVSSVVDGIVDDDVVVVSVVVVVAEVAEFVLPLLLLCNNDAKHNRVRIRSIPPYV
jgi:hypothetical protein